MYKEKSSITFSQQYVGLMCNQETGEGSQRRSDVIRCKGAILFYLSVKTAVNLLRKYILKPIEIFSNYSKKLPIFRKFDVELRSAWMT